MKRLIVFVFIFGLIVVSVDAQGFKEQIYRSYISGNIDLWETLLIDNKGKFITPADQYEYAMAHYGFIGYCLSRDQKQRARPFLESVENMANNLLQKYPDDARFLALRGALYGFRISYQPQKAMFIGPKALKKVNMALEKDPQCPQAWIEAGNKDWFMPEVFGGSKTQAMAEYEKAIGMMEKDPGFIKNSWYYLNVNLILSNWYELRGRTFASNEISRKILQIEPKCNWAKEKLEK
jgi:hypothetical protein